MTKPTVKQVRTAAHNYTQLMSVVWGNEPGCYAKYDAAYWLQVMAEFDARKWLTNEYAFGYKPTNWQRDLESDLFHKFERLRYDY